MIRHLAIRNFKILASAGCLLGSAGGDKGDSLNFGPLNVLIGPNGAGKSSLLQAIDFLRAFFRTSVELYLKEKGWKYQDLPNLRQSQKRIRWEVSAELGPNEEGVGAGSYWYSVSLQPRRHLGIGQEFLLYAPPGEAPFPLLRRRGRDCSLYNDLTETREKTKVISLPASIISRLDDPGDRQRYPCLLRFRDWVENFRSYLIWDPKVLRNPDRGKHDEIGPSGEHLASVLGRLRDRNRPAFNKLLRRVKRLFPTITDISVSGSGWGWRTIRIHEKKTSNREVVFNSQQVSDGVLRLLAVTSMLYLDRIPTVLTFEEPENGVHPQLVREVVQILRELTQRRPPNQCQVFVTTHSPYVLDEFFDHPEEVYCVDRRGVSEGAIITRLSENRQVDTVRDTFKRSLGEAWTAGLIGATAR